jgi:hypothetical protein
VAHACNPSYLEAEIRKIAVQGQARQKSRPYIKNIQYKQGLGMWPKQQSACLMWGPEFKPQYRGKKIKSTSTHKQDLQDTEWQLQHSANQLYYFSRGRQLLLLALVQWQRPKRTVRVTLHNWFPPIPVTHVRLLVKFTSGYLKWVSDHCCRYATNKEVTHQPRWAP